MLSCYLRLILNRFDTKMNKANIAKQNLEWARGDCAPSGFATGLEAQDFGRPTEQTGLLSVQAMFFSAPFCFRAYCMAGKSVSINAINILQPLLVQCISSQFLTHWQKFDAKHQQ